MKIKTLIIGLFLILNACVNNTNKEIVAENRDIIVSGTLSNGANTLVNINLMRPNEMVPIDSVRCDEKGMFTFRIKSNGINYYSLKYTEAGYLSIIAKAGDKIHIEGDAQNLHPYKIKGSEHSELVRQLSEKHKEVLDELRSISLESENILGTPKYSEYKMELNSKWDSITKSFHKYSTDFVKLNSKSPAILLALYNQYGPGLPVFDPIQDLNIYIFADSALYSNYPENEAVKSLHSELSTALQQMRNQQKTTHLTEGMKAPDFVSTLPDGTNIALSDLKGKMVLLQIWASWSKPSSEENAYLVRAKQKFGNKLSILQISLDNDKEAWLHSLPKKTNEWYHASDLKRWETLFVDLYGIERIPSNFLINDKGIIVERDIFGQELIIKIEKYIN